MLVLIISSRETESLWNQMARRTSYHATFQQKWDYETDHISGYLRLQVKISYSGFRPFFIYKTCFGSRCILRTRFASKQITCISIQVHFTLRKKWKCLVAFVYIKCIACPPSLVPILLYPLLSLHQKKQMEMNEMYFDFYLYILCHSTMHFLKLKTDPYLMWCSR